MNRTIKVGIFIFALFTIAGFGFYFLFTTMSFNQIMQSFLMSVFSGVFVSFLFILLLLRFFRPKFEISPYICYKTGKYVFKVVNKSIYHSFDVKFELSLMVPYTHVEALPSVTIYSIPLDTASLTTVNRYRKNPHEKDPFSLFAMTVYSTYNIEERIKEEGVFLEFRLTARHGLTGLADRFVQRFPNEGIIKQNHKFCYGCNLNTMPLNHS